MDRAEIGQLSRRCASWNGHSLAFAGGDAAGGGAAPYLLLPDVHSEGGAPVLDDSHDIPASVLLWPLEQLLARHFSLPLANPRWLDADILTQELCEQAGDAAADYWPAWQAGNGDGGVQGIVFGLPHQAKQALASQPGWQECEAIVPDAWVRLSAWPDPAESPSATMAVLDEDQEGLFVGVRGPAGWLGMRRINRASWKADADLAEDVLRTLAAMGWQAGADGSIGRLSAGLLRHLSGQLLPWQGQEEADGELPDRHQANLEAAAAQPRIDLNFRRGAWRKPTAMGANLRRWRHTLVLSAVVALVGFVGGLWQMLALQHQANVYRQDIVSAFHRGLPAQKVMLDPLAQLRLAAGGSAAAAGGGDFMRRLSEIAKARQSLSGWHVQEIDYGDDGMRLFGVAADFAMVNRIRDALVAGGAQDVNIEDTEAQGKQVSFRMAWR